MKKHYFLLFLSVSLLFLGIDLRGQVLFPTSATVRIIPPYTTFLSEMAQAGNDKLERIKCISA